LPTHHRNNTDHFSGLWPISTVSTISPQQLAQSIDYDAGETFTSFECDLCEFPDR
jgi:hypothetical protein